jgi:hypothetical protein
MTRYLIVVGMVGLTALAACKDSTAPDPSAAYVAPIAQITVPSQAAVGDTVRLDFFYVTAPCDSSVVEIRQGETALRFTAIAYPTQRPCIMTLNTLHRFYYSVFPPHYLPLAITFTQPTGGDSVRIVSTRE